LEGAHGSKITARETAGKVRHDFGSGACHLPSALGTKTRAPQTGITRPLLQLLTPRMFLLKSQTLRHFLPLMRLRATLTGESDLRLFSAVGVRRVSIPGTVLDRMLTKSA
jgi:hypothetical protein